jgi:hypothetical protein
MRAPPTHHEEADSLVRSPGHPNARCLRGATVSRGKGPRVGLTTAQLVNAIGWLATNGAPDWGFSVINTVTTPIPRLIRVPSRSTSLPMTLEERRRGVEGGCCAGSTLEARTAIDAIAHQD